MGPENCVSDIFADVPIFAEGRIVSATLILLWSFSQKVAHFIVCSDSISVPNASSFVDWWQRERRFCELCNGGMFNRIVPEVHQPIKQADRLTLCVQKLKALNMDFKTRIALSILLLFLRSAELRCLLA